MLTIPEPLANHHQVDTFESGVPTLDEWLKRRAAQNQANGASRTFVPCEGTQIVGYYALASSAIVPSAAPGRFRRNIPDPVPVVVLAPMTIARTHQGKAIGRALFQDAARRVIYAAEAIGIRGLLVHALSADAKAFYLRLGLDPSSLEPMTPMATVSDPRAALSA